MNRRWNEDGVTRKLADERAIESEDLRSGRGHLRIERSHWQTSQSEAWVAVNRNTSYRSVLGDASNLACEYLSDCLGIAQYDIILQYQAK